MATIEPIWRLDIIAEVTVSNSTQSKFPELLQLKLPRGTNAALDDLASELHRSKIAIARQAILREVASGGDDTVSQGI
jgi:hypothetical protein